MNEPAGTGERKIVPMISASKLRPTYSLNGQQIRIDDETGMRGGDLHLLPDIPINSYVVVTIDSEPGQNQASGKRDVTKKYRVEKNGDRIVLDENGIPQVIDVLIKEKMPVTPKKFDSSIKEMGDDSTWEGIAKDAGTYGISLCLPRDKAITQGVVTVFTPATVGNYKKAVLG